MTVKIKDVAKAANVSIATVSYVLNDSAPVSEETRARVLEAIKQLGYRPNSTARNLKANETRLIGYAWHNVEQGQMNAILDRFIYQMARAVEAHGYHLLTFAPAAYDPTATYDELIRTSRVDGFIVAETDNNDPRLRRLMALDFPFVAFGRANPDWDFPYVDVDGRIGIRCVTEHLLALGHRRIGCIAWPDGSYNGDARLSGYVEALHTANIEFPPAWIARTRNTIDDGTAAALTLLSLPEADRPTAIVALSDVMAIGTISCIEALGLQVGVDVAVTGFDDDPMSAFLRPALTSLHQPIDAVAERTIEMLVTIIAGKPVEDRHVLLQPELLIRQSSDPSAPVLPTASLPIAACRPERDADIN